MQKPNSEHFHRTLMFYSQNHDYEKTTTLLIESGIQTEEADSLVKLLQQYHRLKERKMGVILSGIGSSLLIFGFILSILLQRANMSIDIALFGPTTIGAILLIWGMAKVF